MIAGKTLREIRWMALVYLLLLEGLAIPTILLWPDIYADLQRSTLFKNLGVDWLKRIGEAVSSKDTNVAYVNWAAVMLFFRSTNLVGIAAAVLLGTGMFAREREAQTFEFLLSRPVSRAAILWQKFWPSALACVLPIYLVSLSAIPWSRHIDENLPLGPLLLASSHAAAFVLLFLSFTAWISVQCRVQAHVAFWVGGLTVLQIGIYLTQRIRQYSIFRLADFDWYGPILAGNLRAEQMFDPVHGPGFTTYVLGGALLCYGLAHRALHRTQLA
ncbi:MAG: ABC transporter permease subunit [Planctomycetes bacterium]|nr:ABC transporter permease subunit [Planctomycetota bacterium]